MIVVIILFIVFRPMVFRPLRFIALMALCAFAMRFCMCTYVFGVPGWIWALGRFLCCVVQNTLVLHGCLVFLLVAFLVPCLGEFLICLG